MEQAAQLGLKLRTEVTTIEKFDFGVARWDIIVLTYSPTKAVAPHLGPALKPGGIVIVERVLKYGDGWARPDWSARQIDMQPA